MQFNLKIIKIHLVFDYCIIKYEKTTQFYFITFTFYDLGYNDNRILQVYFKINQYI